MRKRSAFFLAVALMASVAVGNALAQSSGNFTAAGTAAACEIGAAGALSGGTVLTSFTADISTSNGNGNTLDIRPALVTGLFTDTKISTLIPTSSADVGIKVCVTVDGSGAGILPTDCAVYNQRFQQISSQLFSQLTACTAATFGACTTTADCTGTGVVCVNPTGGTGTGLCTGPNPLCNFDLILSTLSANSFDFVVPVGNAKPHVIKVSWSVIGSGVSGSGSIASCVGPGIVTVTQTKVFNNSGALTF